MAFLESPRFPININYGSSGGPVFSTDVVTFGLNGREYRNSNSQFDRRMYNIKYNIKSRQDAINVYEFFLARKGRFEGFRLKDVWDFTTNSDGYTSPTNVDQALGTGDASETDFQLVKAYAKGAGSYTRNIFKPVTGTVKVALDAADQTEGVDFTVGSTGIITFTSAPGAGVAVTAGCEFDIPVRFDIDDLSSLQFIFSTRKSPEFDILSFPDIPLIEIRDF